MTHIATIQTELVYKRPAGNATASAIVPPDVFAAFDAEKNRLGCTTIWEHRTDPHTGLRQPAFTPVAGGRLELIERQGIRHGDRFRATIEITEVLFSGVTQRRMGIVDAQPL